MTPTPQGVATPTAKNHQEIVDALDGLTAEFSAAYKAASAHADARRAELVSQCGALGHLFGKNRGSTIFGAGRLCVYCSTPEPKEVAHG